MNKQVIGFGLIGLAVLTAVFAFLFSSTPSYSISDGNQIIEVKGDFDTVSEILAEATLPIRPEDITLPPREDPPPSNNEVEVKRAMPVSVNHHGQTTTYWTHQPTLRLFFNEIGIRPLPGDEIVADGTPITLAQLQTYPLPKAVHFGKATTVIIIDGNEQQMVATTAKTVANALLAAEIPVNGDIMVDPPLHAPLEDNMVIRLHRGVSVTIELDGSIISTQTNQTIVQAILSEAGIQLGELDYTIPELAGEIDETMNIKLVRVTEELHYEDTELPYQTVWQPSSELNLDTQAIISYGQVGLSRQEIRVRYENGVEVGRTVANEWIEQEPINEVYGYGTKIELGTVNTPSGPREYWRVVRMRVTSYTAASSGKSPDDPTYGITASGLPAGYGVVAIDRSVVPFRSEVFVPGYGAAIAGDTGGGVRGRWIDLGYDEDNFESWSGYVDVYYLTPVPAPENINYILPAAPP